MAERQIGHLKSSYYSPFCALSRRQMTFPFCCYIDLVTVFEAILTSRQAREKLQCLYENLMSNNFLGTTVLKKI